MKTENINFHEYKIDIPLKEGRRKIYYYSDILYIVYETPYCVLYCFDKKHLIIYTLEKFLTILPDIFFRCNHSTIVNLSKVKEYSKTELLMDNDEIIHLSRRKSIDFAERIASAPRLTQPFESCFSCSSGIVCCEWFRAKL